MKNTRLLVITTTLALLLTSIADAATREEKRVADSADVLDQLSRIPEKAIPPSLLSRAYAVAVIAIFFSIILIIKRFFVSLPD